MVAINISYLFYIWLFGSGKKVGRTTEIPKPEEVMEQLDSRTVAATPFQYDVTQEDLENFFGQFAKVFVALK